MIYLNSLCLLIISCSIACQTTMLSSNEILNTNQIQVKQTPEIPKESIEIKPNVPKVKWIFLQEPLEFDKKHSFVIGSNAIIFYESGEISTVGINLYEKKNSKPEVIASFDEVVLLGNWTEQKNEIKLKFENCRCQHCGEDHGGEMSKKQMSNFVPFSQIWKLKVDKSDETKKVLVKSSKKYRLVDESDYVFTNYNEMISEPLKIKNAEPDEKCIAFDVEGL